MQKLQNLIVPYDLDGFEQAANPMRNAGFSSMVGLRESTFQGMPQNPDMEMVDLNRRPVADVSFQGNIAWPVAPDNALIFVHRKYHVFIRGVTSHLPLGSNWPCSESTRSWT